MGELENGIDQERYNISRDYFDGLDLLFGNRQDVVTDKERAEIYRKANEASRKLFPERTDCLVVERSAQLIREKSAGNNFVELAKYKESLEEKLGIKYGEKKLDYDKQTANLFGEGMTEKNRLMFPE